MNDKNIRIELYEALDSTGAPYLRPARTVGELPTPTCRRNALDAMVASVNEKLGLSLQEISFGVPIYMQALLPKSVVEKHPERALLMCRGEDLPLSLIECVELHKDQA